LVLEQIGLINPRARSYEDNLDSSLFGELSPNDIGSAIT
jgi:hypothetical protein